ncbi:unnamed protein product [Moneuplotes crassus]|uniref:Uncharacterized protein n=1 Tax=Euplotes crassus TaxID=5936 RepID=A0AAD1XB96_EUPCR|nr:unnamed protein product [Moneuplotes crassus]
MRYLKQAVQKRIEGLLIMITWEGPSEQLKILYWIHQNFTFRQEIKMTRIINIFISVIKIHNACFLQLFLIYNSRRKEERIKV